MRVSIAGRHLEMTDALKGHVEDRLDKVRAHFDKVIDVDVVLSVEKHRHIAEVTVHANGVRIHGKESSQDMYQSVDAVVEKIDRQILKFKDRNHRFQPRKGKVTVMPANEISAAVEAAREAAAQPAAVATESRAIVREPLSMKPMSEAEAALQLDISNDTFLVFSNSETQQVNVMYVKHDGSYGLIEPHF
ncbi:MAG: ribosome-associated translation inhibitor RaiA [Candidatus Hydrogenedentes bacterium]|nr:ribosome-associated translation inhibitor RaiA [Candidatus Hydrogenedentota bacterium]